MLEINFNLSTILLCKSFAALKMIEHHKDSSIVNTQQAMDMVEYYDDGNNCFGDIDMMDIDYSLPTILLCIIFADMMIEDKDNTIVNTKQAMDLDTMLVETTVLMILI